MEPRLWSKVIDPDGRETKLDPARSEPRDERGHRVGAQHDDAERRQRGNRHGGAPSPASTSPARPERRRSRPGVNDAWFIGFAPADDPQIAIAVHRRAHQRLRRPDLRRRSSRRSPRRSSKRRLRWLSPQQGHRWSTSATGSSRKIGSGGMADVWLAEDTELDRKVAIKILHDRFAQDSEFVERFQREAQAAAGPPAPERGRRSSTAASSTAPTSSRWSTSTGPRSRSWSRAG